MVAEADESDRSFLKLFPTIAVITNIDHEHLESYGGFDDLQQAFVDFANKVPFYGAVVACADDRERSRAVVAADDAARDDVRTRRAGRRCHGDRRRARGRSVAHGDAASRPDGARAAVRRSARCRLRVPGRHNLQNALAAVAVGLELGLPFDAHRRRRCAEFRGAERRFEVRGEPNGVLVVDDYGHHPTEIAAVLAAARAGSNRRARRRVSAASLHADARRCSTAFGPALAGADDIVLTDIYAAGEEPIPGVTIEALAAVDPAQRGRAGRRRAGARRRAGGGRARRAAGRRRDHARRRVDRHACRSALLEALGASAEGAR